MRLAGEVAIITGAGSGIGRGIALLFAEHGATIMVADWDETGGLETVRQIEAAGGEAAFRRVDVSKEADAQHMVDDTLLLWGRASILVNNAGIVHTGKATDISLDTWQRVIDIDLTGVFLCSRAALPAMVGQGGGAIVNIASIGGLVGAVEMPAYATAKAGVINLTRQLATDYGPDGVRVNCICPGTIVTPMQDYFIEPGEDRAERLDAMAKQRPLRRLGTPRDIGYAALFFASSEASFITGAVLTVDGGIMAAGAG